MIPLQWIFDETFQGFYYWMHEPMEERPISLQLSAKSGNLNRFVRERKAWLEGTLHAPGLSLHKAVQGELKARWVLDRRLVYRVNCQHEDGSTWFFQGDKELFWTAPIASLTTLSGAFYDAKNREIARATLSGSASRIASWMRGWSIGYLENE